MKKNKEQDKIIKYPKQIHISIGFVIIGVMFIYMAYHLFTYITTENVTIYEVSQGSISSNYEYNALAIRSESVISAPAAGDILYLAENMGQVGSKSRVYALDTTGEILSSFREGGQDNSQNLTESDYDKLSSTVSSFTFDYDPQSFNKVYSFKGEMASRIEQLYNISAIDAMDDSLKAAIDSGTFTIFNSQGPGLIVYYTDGYESTTVDNFTSESLDLSKYSLNNLKSQDSIVEGQPVYKIITSDHWYLICEISSDVYNTIKDETYLKVEFLEDETSTWSTISFKEQAGNTYLILALDDSMDRFADDRFVHIKLLQNNTSGLKIPNSSIVEKEFFTIPKTYFYQGNNGDSSGFMVERGSEKEFVTPTIYYETDDYYYIDGESVSKGDRIIKSNSSESYTIGAETDKLKGVYNVNKGYTVFKQIEVLYSNNDYSIIKTGTNYGIAMYDHIVLQGDEVEENIIIN
ncbi:MAG: hypothetical protein K5773_01040 [Pseudobutyrivibrio sp.]|nr:hypothetical protein [Pseudobutyrivibrio sp.]